MVQHEACHEPFPERVSATRTNKNKNEYENKKTRFSYKLCPSVCIPFYRCVILLQSPFLYEFILKMESWARTTKIIDDGTGLTPFVISWRGDQSQIKI